MPRRPSRLHFTRTGIVRETTIHQRDLTSERKARLREKAATIRKDAWVKSGASAAQAILEKGMTLIASLEGMRAIAGYAAIRHELDPLPLLSALSERGLRVALPRISEGAVLSFREWMPGAALERGTFGLWEPVSSEPALSPEVVLAPLLAFDRMGNRLGYGAGYYDASLRKLRNCQRVIAIGVAFDEQEFPEIPREPQDESLDMILTPTRVITCRA